MSCVCYIHGPSLIPIETLEEALGIAMNYLEFAPVRPILFLKQRGSAPGVILQSWRGGRRGTASSSLMTPLF